MSVTNRRTITWVGVCAVAVMLATSAALGERELKEGPFTSVLIAPPDCTSPVGICTLGTLTGDFHGTYYFVMDTLVPANDDPAHPNKLYYTGHSLITKTHGGATIIGEDSGVMFFDPINVSSFVTTVEIVGGTKQFENAHGRFVASGDLNFALGTAEGTYVALIRKGDD